MATLSNQSSIVPITTQGSVVLPKENLLKRALMTGGADALYSYNHLPLTIGGPFYLPFFRYPTVDLHLINTIRRHHTSIIQDAALNTFFEIKDEFSQQASPARTKEEINKKFNAPSNSLEQTPNFNSSTLKSVIYAFQKAYEHITHSTLFGFGASSQNSAHALFLCENYEALEAFRYAEPTKALLEKFRTRRKYFECMIESPLFKNGYANTDTQVLDTLLDAERKCSLIEEELSQEIEKRAAAELLQQAKQNTKKSAIQLISACIALVGDSKLGKLLLNNQVDFLDHFLEPTQTAQKDIKAFRHSELGSVIFEQTAQFLRSLLEDKTQYAPLELTSLFEFSLLSKPKGLHSIFEYHTEPGESIYAIQHQLLKHAGQLLCCAVILIQLNSAIRAAQLTTDSTGKYAFYLLLPESIQQLYEFSNQIKEESSAHIEALQELGKQIKPDRTTCQAWRKWANENLVTFNKTSLAAQTTLQAAHDELYQLHKISLSTSLTQANLETTQAIQDFVKQLQIVKQLLPINSMNTDHTVPSIPEQKNPTSKSKASQLTPYFLQTTHIDPKQNNSLFTDLLQVLKWLLQKIGIFRAHPNNSSNPQDEAIPLISLASPEEPNHSEPTSQSTYEEEISDDDSFITAPESISGVEEQYQTCGFFGVKLSIKNLLKKSVCTNIKFSRISS